jgi:hypothetical protein
MGRLPTSIDMAKHKTDLTPVHWPHDYELVSYNEDAYGSPDGKTIQIGTKEQCDAQLKAIWRETPEYAAKCKVVKA